MIKRYHHGPVAIHADPDFEESPDGDVVLWADHEADRAALVRELEEARASDLQTGEVLAQTHAAHVKAQSEVARLTSERDEAREAQSVAAKFNTNLLQQRGELKAEIARLTEELEHAKEQATQCLLASTLAAEQNLAAAEQRHDMGGGFYFDALARRKLWELCQLARREGKR